MADSRLLDYIRSKGYSISTTLALPQLPTGISSHPDLQMCRLGINDSSPVIKADEEELAKLGSVYPHDIPFNAACTGRFLICNAEHTSSRILKKAELLGLTIINVRQGYAKCSCVVVDENSIITYDRGIAREALKAGLDVLTVAPGHVKLEGYGTGFIGGTSGRIGDTIVFNGSLDTHPDTEAIRDFIRSRGLAIKEFDYELTDIGSII